jgi:hypothetical protein
MTLPVLWNIKDWARAIERLATPGPLPARTVLVPSEAVAHTLRRELIRAGLAHVLAGTRFVLSAIAALEVLRNASVEVAPGEEHVRPSRLLALFRQGLPLAHFPLDLLRATPGWDEAFARSITDLEGAGLCPEDLEAHAQAVRETDQEDRATSDRLCDVATVWHALDAAAGRSWTTQRIYGEAALQLEASLTRWPFDGPALAAVTGHETSTQARFLRAVPSITLAIIGTRPAREHHLGRLEALFGPEALEALRPAAPPRSHASERDLLASYFMEQPALLADPARPRSAGPDGTVDLEEHAGLEDEIEAATDWVARQILDGIPLEEIAVLLPMLDPLVGLLTDRLKRLPWPDGSVPVHVLGGIPLVALPGGARVLAVVRALRAYLGGEALASVLPSLRTVGEGERHLAHGPAMELVWSLGTAGGSLANPGGALAWSQRLAAREPTLASQLEQARVSEDDPDRPVVARRARDLERVLGNLRAARPAIDALVSVAQLVVNMAPLGRLWPALRAFLDQWLLQPGGGPRVSAIVDERLASTISDPRCGDLAGDDALRLLEETIAGLRITVGRFGEPAVTIATVSQAAGLSFRAVRVIGLSEGHLPSMPREDPVVPDPVRVKLCPRRPGWPATIGPPTAADRALGELHALNRVIRAARDRLALSMARFDRERSQREPSSVFVEAGAALARPDAATGRRGPAIPDLAALRRDAFGPARAAATRFRRSTPLGEAAWQDGVAAGALSRPPHWRLQGALDHDRTRNLLDERTRGSTEGFLGAIAAGLTMPGLTPHWPISPTALERLLACPHRFLFETLLGFAEPAGAPDTREIDALSWGSLFHAAAEAVYREHGVALCAGRGNREDLLSLVEPIVGQVFDGFLEQYPLVGEPVRDNHRHRLWHDIRDLLEADWGAREFAGAERVFGRPDPVRLPVGRHTLFLRGRIDRLDLEHGRTMVRDLKTGRPYPRIGKQATPDHRSDVQIATYGLVAQLMAKTWGVPGRIGAAYAYFGRRGVDERDFRDDFDEVLAPAAREWLALAAELLTDRVFPRTPEGADCEYCPFRPVCGPDAQARATRVLADAGGTLAAFRALKRPQEEDD